MKNFCPDSEAMSIMVALIIPIANAYRDTLLYNHVFFVVRAEVFHGIIVASHSCTEYHWGTLIALYRAVHQAQLMNWQKTSPFGTSRPVPTFRHFSGKPVPVHREGRGQNRVFE